MVTNTRFVFFKKYTDNYGNLIPLEVGEEIPFNVNRAYYIYNVEDGVRRGFHSHRKLEQILVCVHGSVKILLKTPFQSEDVILDNPEKGLYIGPAVWRELYDFSPDAVLMVFASRHYEIQDYIRDYSEYEAFAREYFIKQPTSSF